MQNQTREAYPGMPLKVGRGIYTHHGIYAGQTRDGTHVVIGYDGELFDWANASIREVTWEQFAAGGPVQVDGDLEARAAYNPQEVLQNAYSRLGERKFNLLGNNCEHFVSWSVTGQHRSRQVDNVVGTVGAVSVFALICVGVAALARA